MSDLRKFDSSGNSAMQDFGILVVGHGTRKREGADQLLELVSHMKLACGGRIIEASFLELAEPTIEVALERLAAVGIRKVLVIPILLFTAAHARADIPEAVNAVANRLGIEVIGQSESLGTHPAALQLSKQRLEEALRCTSKLGCLKAGACDRAVECVQAIHCAACDIDAVPREAISTGRIGLAMVGRGTSDQEALDHMRRFTELKVQEHIGANTGYEFGWYATGFFAGGKPTVDDLLAEAQSCGCDTVVVQPHLLFEGELSYQLREKVTRITAASSNQRWLVTPTLGNDRLLAETFLALAKEISSF